MNETLKTYVCEKCGGELKEIGEGRFLCPYCRVEYYKETSLPDELILDLHSANRSRGLQKFEDALNEYDRIIASYPDCFDAYWGAALSDYGIQYEKDYDGRMIPTVHRFSETPVFENSYYVNALAYCKNEQEMERIERSAAEIERIRAEIKKTVGSQEPYDIFLCYKETPVGNPVGFTSEFYWAAELYGKLMGEGYRVFFAKESLPASKGDYEAHIFPALKSAKLMLILTTSVENVESVWVKNEWSRFIRFSRENPNAGKRFKVIQSGFKPESLPRELRKEQVLNHDSMGWVEQLYGVIRDTFRDKEKEEEERRKREADEQAARFAQMLAAERQRWAAEEQKKQEEENARRKAEEQKRRDEEARKLEESKNEERIRELERQLAEATKTQSSSISTSASENGYEIVLTGVAQGKKLNVIKAIRETLGLGLVDAKNLVEKAPSIIKSGIGKEETDRIKRSLEAAGATLTVRGETPSEPLRTASEYAAKRSAERAAEDTCDIILENVGPKKLDVISIVRKYYGLGLKDAKDFVESAPRPLEKGAKKSVANMIKTELEAVGATVTVTSDEFWDAYNELKASIGKDSGNTVYKDVITDSSSTATKPSATAPSQSQAIYIEKSLKDGYYKGYAINDVPSGQGTMEYTSGGKYVGNFVGGKRSGKGKYYFTEGDTYDGDWVNGNRTGQGTYTFAGGNVYVGAFLDNKRTGKGKMIFHNGDVYNGDWVDGERNGKGRYDWGKGQWYGDYYEGDWLKNKRTGYGKYVYANGSVKEGRFENGVFKGNTTSAPSTPAGAIYIEKNIKDGFYKGYAINDVPSGHGIMEYTSGGRYEGNFIKGSRNGKGKFFFTAGDVYDGDWVNGTRTGKGTYTFANGNVYVGAFIDNKRTGKGKLTYANGDVYEGDFVEGYRTGKGVYVWKATGNTYAGDFVNNLRSGKGTFTWRNGQWKGDTYYGDWKDDKRTGMGTYTFANGKVKKGRFEDGVFKG